MSCTAFTVSSDITDITDEVLTGSISIVDVTGGNDPYTYLWEDSDGTHIGTSSIITGLAVGDYTCTITDDDGCASIVNFSIHDVCADFNLSEFKVFVLKAQCCLGKLSLKYNKLLAAGREDLTIVLSNNLKILWMTLQSLYCIDTLNDNPCLTCTQIQSLMDKINKICTCDCCTENGETKVDVTYDESTGTFYTPPLVIQSK